MTNFNANCSDYQEVLSKGIYLITSDIPLEAIKGVKEVQHPDAY